MSEKISKQEAKQPDTFISFADKVGQAVANHFKMIVTVAGVALILGGGYVLTEYITRQKELSAQEAIFKVENQYRKLVEDKLEAQMQSLEDKDEKTDSAKKELPDKPIIPEKTPDSLKADYGEVLGNYKTVISSHKGRTAALLGAIDLAFIHSEYKDYDGAKSVLELVIDDAKVGGLFFGMVHNQMGTIYSNLNQYDEAVKHYSLIVEDPKQEHMHPDVLLKMGLAYEKLNQTDQARKMYERVSEEYATSSAGKTAKSYLRIMQLKAAPMADQQEG